MQIVLEQKEIVELVMEALEARGIKLSKSCETRIRKNNKSSTIRLVLIQNQRVIHE